MLVTHHYQPWEEFLLLVTFFFSTLHSPPQTHAHKTRTHATSVTSQKGIKGVYQGPGVFSFILS